MKTSLIPTEKSLSDFINEAKGLIAKDQTLEAIRFVRNHLPENSPKYDSLILLESRHERVLENVLKHIISTENEAIEKNKVSNSLMGFLSILKEEDFSAEAKNPTAETNREEEPDLRIGKTLYQIPHKMQLQEEVECKIWIAFDLDTILQEVEKSDTDAVRDIRISNVMGVELFAHNNNDAFEISTYDSTEQIIEKGLPTEWAFYVKPLAEGKHPLILRISVIEVIDGEKVHKTKVLREIVQIVAETIEPLEEGIETKKAEGLVFATPDNKDNKPKGEAIRGGGSKGGKSVVAILKTGIAMALTLIVGYSVYNSDFIGLGNPSDGTSADLRDWQQIEHTSNPNEVITYLETHPNSKQDAMVFQRMDIIVDSLSNTATLNRTAASTVIEKIKNITRNSLTKLPRLVLNLPPIIESIPTGTDTLPEDSLLNSNPVVPNPVTEDTIEIVLPIVENPETKSSDNNQEEESIDENEPIDENESSSINAEFPYPSTCAFQNAEERIACTEATIQKLILADLNKIEAPKGSAIVSFTITPEGVQDKLQVVRGSNSHKLDKAIRETVRNFPKFSLGKKPLKKQMEVSYDDNNKKWILDVVK
ncbi:MAG: TonB family protein [Paraglaciecola sp.]|jgi:TonB family protein